MTTSTSQYTSSSKQQEEAACRRVRFARDAEEEEEEEEMPSAPTTEKQHQRGDCHAREDERRARVSGMRSAAARMLSSGTRFRRPSDGAGRRSGRARAFGWRRGRTEGAADAFGRLRLAMERGSRARKNSFDGDGESGARTRSGET